ncbi:MAG: dipicolinate synthase [Ruminococcaceae bacterium]|nr:dipicolinate synthase [Oscillospiraceae bacterium]
MKGLIIGGDERFPHLWRMLSEKGHGFFPLAMEKALSMEGPVDYAGIDCAILPLPAQRSGNLNAPLCGEVHKAEEFLEKLRPGTVVWAGMAGETLSAFCRQRGLILKDYFASEALQRKNALLTAEGALALMLTMDGKCLCGRQVLISGFGRIARLLAPRLRALGMRVCVAARSEEDRVLAEAMGLESVKISQCAKSEWDFVVNTVPSVIFKKEELSRFGDAALIELASPPYGFDMTAAEELGIKVTIASALPSRFGAESAAGAIKDAILEE